MIWIAIVPLVLYLLFLNYVLVMGFKRALPMMNWYEKALAYPSVIVGIPFDWLVNVTIASLLFWDKPGEWGELVTGRLKRYLEQEAHYGTRRRYWAGVICHTLDKFDPGGKHC